MNREERYVVVGAHTVKDVLDYDYLSLKDCCKVLNQQNQQIKDIETKLAESEEAIKYLKGIKRYDIGEMLTENAELKQQLAEKEKEIENLYNRLNSKQKFYEMGLEKDYKEYLSRLNKLEKQCDQDKISFCIEKLEKVKHYAKHIQGGLIDYIDNQIEELKKEQRQ